MSRLWRILNTGRLSGCSRISLASCAHRSWIGLSERMARPRRRPLPDQEDSLKVLRMLLRCLPFVHAGSEHDSRIHCGHGAKNELVAQEQKHVNTCAIGGTRALRRCLSESVLLPLPSPFLLWGGVGSNSIAGALTVGLQRRTPSARERRSE